MIFQHQTSRTHGHDNYAWLPTFHRKTNIETSNSMTAECVFLLVSPKRGQKPNLTSLGLVDFMYAANTALFTGKFDARSFIKGETFAQNPYSRRTDFGQIHATEFYRPFPDLVLLSPPHSHSHLSKLDNIINYPFPLSAVYTFYASMPHVFVCTFRAVDQGHGRYQPTRSVHAKHVTTTSDRLGVFLRLNPAQYFV